MSQLLIGSSLGSGAYGTVFRAQWGSQLVAAKSFFLSQSDFAQAAIQNEIQVLQKLRHRHIIQFYRTQEQDGQIYILMDLAENGNLSGVIEGGELANDWSTKKRIAHEIARGLEYIHHEGVLHRDLKSANVLLSQHMEVKLADFGLAKVKSMSSSKSGGSFKGTMRWAAPELFFSTPMYSAKSDVYALGMVMWEMAAGCTQPFQDHYNNALLAFHVKNGLREELPKDTPSDYCRWVEQCWEKEPDKRPKASEVILVDVVVSVTVASADDDASFIESGTTIAVVESAPYESKWRQVAKKGKPPVQYGVVQELPLWSDNGDDSDDSDHPLSNPLNVMLLFRAAQRGMSGAQCNLGTAYARGKGVEQSDELAVQWYLKSAAQGFSEAQERLEEMYSQGRSDVLGEDDEAETLRQLHMKADERRDPTAQHCLGRIYEYGRYGVERSFFEAASWYRKVAEQGSRDAQYDLARLCWDGEGVPEWSQEEAVLWFRKAAENGHVKAQAFLGGLYAEGNGVEQSNDAAISWLRKAASQGNAAAQYNIAVVMSRLEKK
ncbi:MAG: kinase-like domain-containing protein [Podila humilis]|nr:MAG: kinase-like domain-containing protein [Podila humilis]